MGTDEYVYRCPPLYQSILGAVGTLHTCLLLSNFQQIYMQTFASMYIHVYLNIYMYMLLVLIHMHITVYMYIHIHIYMYMYTAANILTEKQCNCRDIIHCKCPQAMKCLVRLADFDSAKPIKSPMIPQNRSPLPYIPKTPDECGKVMGTPGYRAPEVDACSCTGVYMYICILKAHILKLKW